MSEKLAYSFTVAPAPELAQVGGKAMSLIAMTQHGLPVPPGFVLSVAFFDPWLATIQSTPQWARVLDSAPGELKQNCDEVKALALGLELGDVQEQVLAEMLASLDKDDKSAARLHFVLKLAGRLIQTRRTANIFLLTKKQ